MKVGQKVVCIDTFMVASIMYPECKLPVKGEIYTVREVTDYGGIKLVEIVNVPSQYKRGFLEACFNVESFRPIDELFGEEVCSNLEKELEPQTV